MSCVFFQKKTILKLESSMQDTVVDSSLVEQNIDFLIFYYIKVFTALHKNAPNSSKRLWLVLTVAVVILQQKKEVTQ